jgi:hypothetical protein
MDQKIDTRPRNMVATVMNLGRIRRIAPATWGQIRMRPHLALHYALLPRANSWRISWASCLLECRNRRKGRPASLSPQKFEEKLLTTMPGTPYPRSSSLMPVGLRNIALIVYTCR